MHTLGAEPPHLRLRNATALLHRRVEEGVDLLRRAESVEETVELLRRMEAFYRVFEPALARGLAKRVPAEFLAPRLPRLHRDLDVLAPGWSPLPAPEIPGLSDALGGLYVLEGAALGGQIIARRLAERLGFRSEFFGSEGVGPRWRAFRALLDRTDDYSAVEASAAATFLAFEAAVVPPSSRGAGDLAKEALVA